MIPRGETGIFLERQRYRQRRLIDGLRLVPVLGAWLFMLPLLWPVADAGAAKSMSSALVYVFLVWVSLTLVAACLSFATWSYDDHDGAEQDAER